MSENRSAVKEELGYAFMRLSRLVITIGLESVVFGSLFGVFFTVMNVAMVGQVGSGVERFSGPITPTPLQYWCAEHWAIVILVLAIAFVSAIVMMFSVGIPYRYEHRPPGLPAERTCSKCNMNATGFFCGNKECGTIQVATPIIWFVRVAGMAITVLWVTHDLAQAFALPMIAGGRK